MNDFFWSLAEYKQRIDNGLIILDNFIPDNILDMFIVHAQSQIDWNMSCYEGTSSFSDEFLKEIGSKRTYEQFQFVSMAVNQTQGMKNTFTIDEMLNYHFWSLPLTLGLMKLNLSLSAKHIIRIKANLQTKAPQIAKDKFNFPHCDLDQTRKDIFGPIASTAIFYLNDSDGDTYFFNEPDYDLVDKDNIPYKDYINSLTIMKRVSPKKGRMIIFPSGIVHAGSHPINNNYRLVVNYNFVPMGNIKSEADKELFENNLK